MKKLFAITLTVILAAALVLPVCAGDADYDEDELYSTLKDSFDFYYEFFYRAEEDLKDSSASPIIIESDNGEVMPYNVYYPRNDELADWNKFCDKLHSYYTDEIGNIFIDNMKGFEHSGKVFISETIFGQAQSNAPYFSFHELGIDLETRETFKLIKESDGKLLYEFCLFDQYIDAPLEAPDEDRLLDLTVEFTHTESGWRISGGTVVDTYLYGRSYDYYLNGAPATSLTADEAEDLLTQMDALYWKLQNIPEHIDREKDIFYIEYGEYNASVMAWKPGYSFSDLVVEAETIYTNDIAYDMLALTRTLYYVDGEVVMTSVVPQWHPYNVNGDGLEMNDGMDKDDFTISAKVEFNSENVATIEFNYVHIEHPYENGAVIKRSNVTAVFENGEWQINGGDYIDMLAEYHSYWPIVYPEGTPQTSLTTITYAAVAALALGVVVVKKKKH